jgi:Ca2+-binding EF-hand superfamily protein
MSAPSEAEIKECFDTFDADGSGAIDKKEIKEVCKALGVDASGAEIDELIKQADADGDGKIQYSEFKKAILG